jgi:hypothetical protein
MASVNITPNLVPPAALVTFVQKGLQYMEMEANLEPVISNIMLWDRTASSFHVLQLALLPASSSVTECSSAHEVVSVISCRLAVCLPAQCIPMHCRLTPCADKLLWYADMVAVLRRAVPCCAVLCHAMLCCLQESGEIAKDFSLLGVEDLITKDINELRQQVLENKEKQQEQLRGGCCNLAHQAKLTN